MREYIPAWAEQGEGLSKIRYAELKAFCLRYQERKRLAASLLGPRDQSYETIPTGSGIASDPTFRAVEKREKLLQENALIDQCLQEVAGGAWAEALRQNVCQGKALEHIEPQLLPTSTRNVFFLARKAFFKKLDEMR